MESGHAGTVRPAAIARFPEYSLDVSHGRRCALSLLQASPLTPKIREATAQITSQILRDGQISSSIMG